jgi:hypothetical protein
MYSLRRFRSKNCPAFQGLNAMVFAHLHIEGLVHTSLEEGQVW